MTGVSKPTILKLIADFGTACSKYQDENLKSLSCKRVQCDEIWSFCYAKEKNVPEELKDKFGFGSVWTWTALDADSKLMVSKKERLPDIVRRNAVERKGKRLLVILI